jgi:hypothetical protein
MLVGSWLARALNHLVTKRRGILNLQRCWNRPLSTWDLYILTVLEETVWKIVHTAINFAGFIKTFYLQSTFSIK